MIGFWNKFEFEKKTMFLFDRVPNIGATRMTFTATPPWVVDILDKSPTDLQVYTTTSTARSCGDVTAVLTSWRVGTHGNYAYKYTTNYYSVDFVSVNLQQNVPKMVKIENSFNFFEQCVTLLA